MMQKPATRNSPMTDTTVTTDPPGQPAGAQKWWTGPEGPEPLTGDYGPLRREET